MDGPWYECQGPTAEQVREDVLKYISIKKKGKEMVSLSSPQHFHQESFSNFP